MDEFDRASEREEKDRELCLKVARQAAIKPIQESETCLFCEAPTMHGSRWCDADCRDLWEKENV